MEIGAHTLILIAKVFVWALLLVNSVRLRLIRKYPLVFAMILAWMASEIAMRALESLVGLSNMTYTWAWFGQSFLTGSLTLLVLMQIYSLPAKLSIRKNWRLAALASVLVGFAFFDGQQVWLPSRVVVAFNLLVAFLGVATIVRTSGGKNFRLGWNLRMVLLAVTVPSVFAQLVFNSYVIKMLSYDVASLWVAGAGLAAWLILAVGMMEYSPPVFLSVPEPCPVGSAFAKEATSTRNLG